MGISLTPPNWPDRMVGHLSASPIRWPMPWRGVAVGPVSLRSFEYPLLLSARPVKQATCRNLKSAHYRHTFLIFFN